MPSLPRGGLWRQARRKGASGKPRRACRKGSLPRRARRKGAPLGQVCRKETSGSPSLPRGGLWRQARRKGGLGRTTAPFSQVRRKGASGSPRPPKGGVSLPSLPKGDLWLATPAERRPLARNRPFHGWCGSPTALCGACVFALPARGGACGSFAHPRHPFWLSPAPCSGGGVSGREPEGSSQAALPTRPLPARGGRQLTQAWARPPKTIFRENSASHPVIYRSG